MQGDDMIKYDALWETMKKKNVSQYGLINKYNISRGLIHRLKNGVDYICTELVCIYEKLEINDAEKKKTIEKYLR